MGHRRLATGPGACGSWELDSAGNAHGCVSGGATLSRSEPQHVTLTLSSCPSNDD